MRERRTAADQQLINRSISSTYLSIHLSTGGRQHHEIQTTQEEGTAGLLVQVLVLILALVLVQLQVLILVLVLALALVKVPVYMFCLHGVKLLVLHWY